MAQSYGRRKVGCRYEIAICDPGVGVRTSLARKSFESDSEAVSVACQKGVSRGSDDYTTHFGYGLWQIDEIARTTYGKFRLHSGTGDRVRDTENVDLTAGRPWQGTALLITLDHSGIARKDWTRPENHGGLRFE